jgi:penicillin-binding protein 2
MKRKITLQNPSQEMRRFKRRIWLLGLSMLVLLAILVGRLTYLQIYQQVRYTTLAQKNQLAIESITPSRGLIYDSNGVLLADNVPVTSLDLVPDKIDNLDQTIAELSKLIEISDDEIEQFNKLLDQRRSFESIPLKVKLTEQEEAVFYINQYKFPGVTVNAHLIRRYLFGQDMSPVLGYVGRINPQELEQADPSNYNPTDYIGKVGIEKYYEDLLHGTAGYEQVEIDASGRAVRTLKRVAPIPGQDLYLTIDNKLQEVAVAALQGTRGAVVAIAPDTGQVLALVSNPSYDSNAFVKGISTKDFKLLRDSQDQPLYNRALRGQYPPASTVKPFMALQGLATGTVTAKQRIYDPGWFKLPNSSHVYRDWKKTGRGWIDMKDAIMQSSDIYFYNLAHEMGIKQMDAMLAEFGFGHKTGIDMREELDGILPSPAWKRRYRGTSWYPGDTVITGIGQGFTVTTPLQLASAVATMATRGIRYKPFLLLKSKLATGTYVTQQAVVAATIELPSNLWNTIIDAMEAVITDPRGTGRMHFGNSPNYTVAAKSGTAQVFSIKQNERSASQAILPERLRDHSLFIGFAPVEQPKIAVAVVVENSAMAGAVARKILDSYLANKDEA